MSEYHIPVLLEESVHALVHDPDGVYVDVTFGGGSHSRAILAKLSDKGRLYAFDQDADATANMPMDPRFTLVQANFRYLQKFLRLHGVKSVDGILGDLGISSHQIDIPERGFSFRFSAPLDMRMNVEESLTAAQVLNTYSEANLVELLSRFGEVRNAKTLAKALIAERMRRPIQSTDDLNRVLDLCVMGHKPKYFAQVYQALRIEVNQEIPALEAMLIQGMTLLKKGGRFVVISYHSLEDRLVKNLFKTGNIEGEVQKDEFGVISKFFESVGPKFVLPSAKEIKVNPRSRSAKLRAVSRL